MVKEILEFNKKFISERGYLKYATDKYPSKKIAILSCMDTRLIKLLPASMGLINGDVKLIKNAGAVITHPYGSVMKSLIMSIYKHGVQEILVIGHYDCGLEKFDSQGLIDKMIESGISQKTIDDISKNERDVYEWLSGFDCVENSVVETANKIRNHPLVPKNVHVHSLTIDPSTGELKEII